MEEEESKLIIQGKGRASIKTKEISLLPEMSEKNIKLLISNAYKKGYDSLTLRLYSPKELSKIEKILQDLIGFEIIDISSDNILIKSVALDLEEEYQHLFRKSVYLCNENMDLILGDIKKGSYPHGDTIKENRRMITRYTDYVKRVLNKKRNQEIAFDYLITRDVEKVSNELSYLYAYLEECTPAVDKMTRAYLEMVFTVFRNLLTNYFKQDLRYIEEFIQKKDQFIFKDFYKSLKNKHLDHTILHHAANILRRCSDMVGPFYGKYL